MSREYELWGVDSVLSGSESHLSLAFPVIVNPRRQKEVLVARKENWSADENVAVLSTDEAAHCVTRVGADSPVRLGPGMLVAVAGPTFRASISKWAHSQFRSWIKGSDGFLFLPISSVEFRALRLRFWNKLKPAVDKLIATTSSPGDSKAEMKRLRIALAGLGEVMVIERTVRLLALDWLLDDPDRFRRSLKIASLKTGLSVDQLKDELNAHLSVVQRRLPIPKSGRSLPSPSGWALFTDYFADYVDPIEKALQDVRKELIRRQYSEMAKFDRKPFPRLDIEVEPRRTYRIRMPYTGASK